MVAFGNLLFALGLGLLVVGVWSLIKPLRRIGIRSRSAALVVISLAAAACVVGVKLAPPPPDPPRAAVESPPPSAPAKPQFEWIIAEGGATDAKAAGLRDCEAKAGGFVCRRGRPLSVLGLPAHSASAYLAYPPEAAGPARERSVADLRYDEVVLTFASREGEPCPDAEERDSRCAPSQREATAVLEERLLADGWKPWTVRWGREYLKDGEGVSLTVGTAPRYRGTLTVRSADPAVVQEKLKLIAADAKARATAAAERRAFLGDMKAP